MMCLQQPIRCLLLGIALVCIAAPARALDPNRLPSQYVRRQWIVGSTFPGGAVNAIAQTADGYLWIGTDKGLVRFDGFTFSPVSLTPVASASGIPILQLLTDLKGQLWIRPEGADVVHQKNGRFERVEYGEQAITSQITAMAKVSHKGILVSDIAKGTFLFRGDEVERLAKPAVLSGSASPPIISIAQGDDGGLWIGTLGVGLFHFANGRATRVDAGLPDRKINCLLVISKDELWVGTDTGLFRWDGKEFHRINLPPALGRVQVLSILRDRDSNIWAGTTRGLLRINSDGVSFSPEDGFAAMVVLMPYLRIAKAISGSEVPRDLAAFATVRFLPIRLPSILDSSTMDLFTLTARVALGSLQRKVGCMRLRTEAFNQFQPGSRQVTWFILSAVMGVICGWGASTVDSRICSCAAGQSPVRPLPKPMGSLKITFIPFIAVTMVLCGRER